MSCSTWILSLIICLSSLVVAAQAQQPYTDDNCGSKESSALGYACNGLNPTCQTYLIYSVQPPYNNVSSVANLFSVSSSSLSLINSLSATAPLATNQTVIVPVTCSCSGGTYYQANTTYVVLADQTIQIIGSNVFQGLTTCEAIENDNGKTANILTAEKLTIPLRCACPTKNQTDEGIKYLLTYLIETGDSVSSIAARFGADLETTLDANELSDQNANIYPSTTLLVPLQSPPNSSELISSSPSQAQSPPPPSPSSGSRSSHRWSYFGGGVAAGAAFVGLAVGGILFCLLKQGSTRRKTDRVIPSQKPEAMKGDLYPQDQESLSSILISSVAESLKIYSFKEVRSATSNFSPSSSWIKGSVYRGSIGGDTVAIKKVEGDATQEIDFLNKINHSNIISLLGICFEKGQWYLVYEYTANGSLSDWIHNEDGDDQKLLSWTQRMQIAFDVATGLDYLHSYTTPPLVHKNIKSSNILLDSDFRAKITNFGQSRSVGGEEEGGQFASTKHVVGTKGYMAPEYLQNGLISFKLDVYSFGVLLLEILTGKKANELYEQVDAESLIRDGDGDAGLEKLRSQIDPSLQDMYPGEAAMVVLKLASRCLRKEPGDRPTMNETAKVMSKTLSISLLWETSSSNSGSSSIPITLTR